jgi:hypothetical protein
MHVMSSPVSMVTQTPAQSPATSGGKGVALAALGVVLTIGLPALARPRPPRCPPR